MAYLVGISVSIWCCFAELFYVAATLHIVIVFVAGFIVDKDHYEVCRPLTQFHSVCFLVKNH